MTEVRDELDYGRYTTRYNEAQEQWLSGRSAEALTPLEGVGHLEHLIPNVHILADDKTTEGRHATRFGSSEHTPPHLACASDLIQHVASPESRKATTPTSSQLAGNLIAFASVTDRHAQTVRLVAFATGERGQELCLVRGTWMRESWGSSQSYNAILTTRFDQSKAFYFNALKGPILQITMSGETKRGQVLVALRYQDNIMVLRASLTFSNRRDQMPPPGIVLRTLVEPSAFTRNTSDVLSLSFDASVPARLLSIHSNHQARLWSLPHRRYEQVVLDQELAIVRDRTQGHQNVPANLIPIGKHRFALGFGRQLVAFDFRHSESRLAHLDLAFPVLDVRQCPKYSSLVIVVTTRHIVWVTVTYFHNAQTPRLRLLSSWSHHRNTIGATLKLSVVWAHKNGEDKTNGDGQAGCFVLIHSQHDSSIQEYRYCFGDAGNEHLEEQLTVYAPRGLPVLAHQSRLQHPRVHQDNVSSVRLFPVTYEWNLKDKQQIPNNNVFRHQPCQFFQAFVLCHDRALSSCIMYRPVLQSFSEGVQSPFSSRSRGSRILSGVVATERFVAEDDEQNSKQSIDTNNGCWWVSPRRERFRVGDCSRAATSDFISWACDASRQYMLHPTISLVSALRHSSQWMQGWKSSLSASTQLCAQLADLNATPEDLLDASEYLQTLLSETAASSKRPGALQALDAPFVSASRPAWMTPYVHSKSLQHFYASLVDARIAPLSTDARLAARSSVEKAARRMAAASGLSMTFIRHCSRKWYAATEGYGNTCSSALKNEASLQNSQESSLNPFQQLHDKQRVVAPRDSVGIRQAETSKLRSAMALIQSYSSISNANSDQDRGTDLSQRILSSWLPGGANNVAEAPSDIVLSRYDVALDVSATKEQQAESQRQLQKQEKQRRRLSEANYRSQQSSQTVPFRSSQSISRHRPQSSQVPHSPSSEVRPYKILQSSEFLLQPHPMSSELGTLLPSSAQDNTEEQSQADPRSSVTNRIQSSSLPTASKRDHHNVFNVRTSAGLPVRKRRKAGF